MPRIKSLLNGEISNVRADIAREMIKLGVATALDPKELEPDGTVAPYGESPYRLPRAGDARPPMPTWSVVITPFANKLAIQRETIWGPQKTEKAFCSFHPASIHDRRAADGTLFCSSFGCAVPEETLVEYKRQWKANPKLRFTEEKVPVYEHPDDRATIEKQIGCASAHGEIDLNRVPITGAAVTGEARRPAAPAFQPRTPEIVGGLVKD